MDIDALLLYGYNGITKKHLHFFAELHKYRKGFGAHEQGPSVFSSTLIRASSNARRSTSPPRGMLTSSVTLRMPRRACSKSSAAWRTASVLGLAQKCCCGLSLLRALRALPSQPALIVCTAFQSETAVQMCQEIGADMFLSKPVPMEQLHECIVDTSRMKRRLQAEQRALEARRESALPPTAAARRLLLSAGIPPRLFGFSCLAEALYLLHQDERRLRNLRRDLYPRVAQSLMTTPERTWSATCARPFTTPAAMRKPPN